MYFPISNIYCFIWNTTELLGSVGIKLTIIHKMCPGLIPWLFGKCIGCEGQEIK